MHSSANFVISAIPATGIGLQIQDQPQQFSKSSSNLDPVSKTKKGLGLWLSGGELAWHV